MAREPSGIGRECKNCLPKNRHLPIRLISLAWLMLTIFLAPQVAAQEAIAITNGLLIDGHGGPPLQNAVVLIRGERIQNVGSAGSVAIPGGARVIDVAGKTVMPGLADMHIHLQGGWDAHKADMLGYQRYLNALLYAGVTTAFDTGNMLPYIHQIRQEIESGRITGPKLYIVGTMIAGSDPIWPPHSYAVASASQIPRYVQRLKRANVDAIKGYAGLSVNEVQRLVEEAEKESVPVFIDQHARNGSLALMRAGVKAFAHLPSFPVSDEALQMMRERDVSFITTLTLGDARRRLLDSPDFLTHPLVHNVTPPWFLEELEQEVASWESENRRPSRLRVSQQNVKRMFDAGVLIAAGTDSPGPGVFNGEALHRELELLVEAGLTPLQAISVATKNAALLMNDGDEWGTLESGKLANILVVDGNPAEKISETRNIEMIIQAGRILNRKDLEYDAAKDPGFRVSTSVRRY